MSNDYLKIISNYSFFIVKELEELIVKKNVVFDSDKDFHLIHSNEILYSCYFDKSFRKIDVTNYKELYLPSSVINKVFKNFNYDNCIYKGNYNYSVTEYFKAISKNEIDIKNNTDISVIKENDYYIYRGKTSKCDISIFGDISIFYHLKVVEMTKIHSLDDFYKKLQEIRLLNIRPKLLLHSCCGPCSSYTLTFLHDYFDITILYYNPNIDNINEYQKRLATQREIVSKLKYDDIKIIDTAYNHSEYLDSISGLESLGEKSLRCYNCYKIRMEEACSFAKKHNFDFFTTTISISPHKVAKWLNEIGIDLEEKYQMPYLYADFKQKGGYLKSIELSKKFNLYRQDYCGCEFSKEKK